MTKEIDINKLLAQENNALNTILSQVNELCEQNKKLQGLIEIQKEVKELEKEHTKSPPWFKRLVKVVSNVKYNFIKSEERLTNEAIQRNDNVLKRIDNTILSIADKSGPLKQELQQEVRKNFDELAKKDLSTEQRGRLEALFTNKYAARSEKFGPLTMVKPLYSSNGEELENQLNSLNATKQSIKNLISENSNIKELKEIQKQVAEIREEIPYTFFEKLNNIWQNVKNAFVNNSEQVLAKNKESNTKTIRKIDEQLYKTKHKFEELIENKGRNINDIIAKLPDNEELQKIVSSLASHMTPKKESILTTLPLAKPLENNIPPPSPPLSQNNIPPPPPMATMIPAQTETLSKPIEATTVKTLENQPRPEIDTMKHLETIRTGIKLNKVEYDKDGKPIPKYESKVNAEKSPNMLDALKQRLNTINLAKKDSDSEKSGSESDSGWISDTSVSSNKLKTLKTRGERDAKMTTHAQKILSNRSSQKPSFVRS
ncbi:Arp2/3 complex-activating protein rickA [Rickettsia endosymbiont of Cantharis rufa]|uniref:Arp2/3 complex-activating protein rickA n=1 Tax=Rickettsia endosymbiont of Cantharis rufa TaxID=3066248 RepID=UPI003132D7A6